MDYSKKKIETTLMKTGSKAARKKNQFVTFIVTLMVILILGAGLVAVSVAVGAYREIIKGTPDVSALEAIRPNEQKSIIYASDGSIMQELITSGSNRIEIPYEEMPRHLINAFVAIEDSRFFSHEGIDIKGILRALFVDITSGNMAEGASTITQQLIKNVVFEGGFEYNYGDRIMRKIQEQYLALKVEQSIPKETIIQNYLNTINLGANCLGVEVASLRYFNKHAKDLDLSEATVLAATTSNPTRYNPIKYPENNQRRRLIVLKYMLDQELITKDEYQNALSDDVYIRLTEVSDVYSAASSFSYFTDEVFEEVAEALQTEAGYTETQAYNALYSGGLRIYSTMDPAIQKIVEEEVNRPENYIWTMDGASVNYLEYSLSYRLSLKLKNGSTYYYDETSLKNYYMDVLGYPNFTLTFSSEEACLACAEQFKEYMVLATQGEVLTESVTCVLQPQTSFLVMDQYTGEVKACVGGRGEKKASLVLNRTTQSFRQPGSTFKTLAVYAPAIDIKGCTLGSTMYDSELMIDGRSIKNWWGNTYFGYANIREGIMSSMNILAIRFMENVVTENLAYEYARSFGITSLTSADKSPNLAIGGLTYGVSNLELSAAYAAIGNDGIYNTPIFWTKVTDLDGNIILSRKANSRRVIQSSTAKLLTSALASTVDPEFVTFPSEMVGSTNGECHIDRVPVAVKSGTTNDANDLWISGFTPYYTATIWSGYDSSKAFGDPHPGYHKIIWQKIMSRIHENLLPASFDYSGLVKATICSKSGLLAKEGVCDACQDPDCHVYEEYFTEKTVPKETCNRHATYKICKTSGCLATDRCPESEIEERIYISIPSTDPCETTDSQYAIPEDLIGNYCNTH